MGETFRRNFYNHTSFDIQVRHIVYCFKYIVRKVQAKQEVVHQSLHCKQCCEISTTKTMRDTACCLLIRYSYSYRIEFMLNICYESTFFPETTTSGPNSHPTLSEVKLNSMLRIPVIPKRVPIWRFEGSYASLQSKLLSRIGKWRLYARWSLAFWDQLDQFELTTPNMLILLPNLPNL